MLESTLLTKLIRSTAIATVSLTAGLLLAACGVPDATDNGSVSAEAAKGLNLCVGQAANTFHCIDDTKFQQCTGNGTFVVNSCPPGLCATRHPAEKNPCIGAARATQIDGVPPTPAGQIDNGGAANNGGGNNGGGGNQAGGVCTLNLCVGQPANTFHCEDDTSFQLCTGNGNFIVNSCPKGFCATRHPAEKNPCIGAARAAQIDGVPPTPACTRQ
jgi:hypothetical protein